mmetsp:Transcript_35902/g.34953  ORF Transcript_35902/g.34953 Transcript_35902/m.34953 type:complete len:86 (+) Transcript_35902:103-360(+)
MMSPVKVTVDEMGVPSVQTPAFNREQFLEKKINVKQMKKANDDRKSRERESTEEGDLDKPFVIENRYEQNIFLNKSIHMEVHNYP